jgi:hypothetical protein
MRKIFIVKALIAFLMLPFVGLSQEVREIELTPFNKLKVTGKIVVYATQGEKPKAKIVVTGIPMENVIVSSSDNTLEFKLKIGIQKKPVVEVYLTYVNIEEVIVTTFGKVSFQGLVTGDKVVFNTNSGGVIDADVKLNDSDLKVDKGGSILIGGTIGKYKADISFAGNLSAMDLKADSVYLNVSTKGIAKVNASKLIEAKIKSKGTLTYSGNPTTKSIKLSKGVTVNEQEE